MGHLSRRRSVFFESPDPIYRELEGSAVAIISSPNTAKTAGLLRFGTYNVGWVGARNDRDGIEPLLVAREMRRVVSRLCRWRSLRDQGYLNSFSNRFRRVKIIENVGANLAPGIWQLPDRFSRRQSDDRRDFSADIFSLPGAEAGPCWFIFRATAPTARAFSADVRNTVIKPMSMSCWRSKAGSIRSCRLPMWRLTAIGRCRSQAVPREYGAKHAQSPVPAAGRGDRPGICRLARYGV